MNHRIYHTQKARDRRTWKLTGIRNSEAEEASNAPDNILSVPVQSQFCVDLENLPTPHALKARIDNHPARFAHVGGRNKQNKPPSMKEATHDTQPEFEAGTHQSDKALHRRKNRETRKMLEEHWTKQSLENNTLPALIASVSPADTDTLVDGLEKLHVGAVETVMARQ